MISRIFLLLIAGTLPLCAQASLNNGGRIVPQDQQTVQPAPQDQPESLRPGVDSPPPGTPPPGPELPAPPAVHCYLKEFTVAPTIYRENIYYKDDLKTVVTLNVPAPRRMVFHITTSSNHVVCTDIVLIKNAQRGVGGISIVWAAITHDTTIDFKAFAADEPDLILHGRIYLKKHVE